MAVAVGTRDVECQARHYRRTRRARGHGVTAARRAFLVPARMPWWDYGGRLTLRRDLDDRTHVNSQVRRTHRSAARSRPGRAANLFGRRLPF